MEGVIAFVLILDTRLSCAHEYKTSILLAYLYVPYYHYNTKCSYWLYSNVNSIDFKH